MSVVRRSAFLQEVGASPLHILVVQRDDPAESELLGAVLQRRDAMVAWERNLRQAREALASQPFDVVLTETRLPDGTGMDLIAGEADRLKRWATILLTECRDADLVASARSRGAFAVIDRSDGSKRLLDAITRVEASRPRRPVSAQSIATRDAIIGEAPSIVRLREQVRRIAPVPADVLVIGETGTGKDLAAREIHARSGRPGAFIALNCGAIPDTLFESELFGREEGAFTGATKARAGKIEQAHQGTLFLDEIESMPLTQQVKLLRVLETRSVGRVGGRGEVTLDLRVVAAAQERLHDRCRQGLFRLDLWHRLNVITLYIPPLRERREDIVPLFRHYVGQAAARFGIDPATLGDFDAARLISHPWPGNVRELRHAADRFVLHLPALPDEPRTEVPAQGLASYLDHCERELILSTLKRHGLKLRAAAEELGVSEKTLQRRIAAYRLNETGTVPRDRSPDSPGTNGTPATF